MRRYGRPGDISDTVTVCKDYFIWLVVGACSCRFCFHRVGQDTVRTFYLTKSNTLIFKSCVV